MIAVASADAAKFSVSTQPLSPEELRRMDAYWRAANYLSVGQIYLFGNPLLREPLKLEHVKPRLLGHWGTTPGLNFIYVHFNRLIKKYDLNVIYICGPGHGGPGMVANTYLEGTYTELYSSIQRNEEGMRKLFKQFSFPGGIPSHDAPETPGSIHEGGELGYSLAHAYGAVFDNPDLVACCVVGDGESETGPLATSWHSNKFLNPARDGAVLPILHLNGYKIANPTVLGRLSDEELTHLFNGYGYKPYFVEGHEPETMHQLMAATLDTIIEEIHAIQREARGKRSPSLPVWPMIVMRTPKGWTGPKFVDGKPVEGTWRAHQVPVADLDTKPEHLAILEDWMKSYHPEELFDENGTLTGELSELAPKGNRRMGSNPHANGGLLVKDLLMPDFRDYAVSVPKPGTGTAESTKVLGTFLRDVMKRNLEHANFRVFGPDETASNRLDAVYQATDKIWMEPILPVDEHLSPDGWVMEILSEHMCQGWLEGYLLTGRHGFFSCYEGFVHIVDSMFNQHAKWLEATHKIPWRRPISSLNYLLTSHVWRQDFPDLKIRVVNVVDLMTLQPPSEHPHGLSDREFDSIFTTDKPVIFAYHGYPWLIHRLCYRRHGHDNFHVRGYKEEGTTTTPFDMTVMNDLDRFHLAGDAVDRIAKLHPVGAHFQQFLRNKLVEHKQHTREHGDDMPEVKNWKWPY